MKKTFALIKASMSEGMNLFKINTKKKSKITQILLPIFLVVVLMGTMYGYSDMIMEKLEPVNMEFVVLTIFVLVISLLTIIEGIYKSGSLLFNCKDDNLLLSLPIKKSMVLFIRVFKFYIFELLYNSLFLLPSMICYAIHVHPDAMFYFVSIIGLLLFPIIPILISCLIGTVITYIASKFKGKNIAQTVLTVGLILVIMYFSYNTENLLSNLAKNASSVNDFITKLYYPAGAYIELITKFDALKLLEFVAINIALFVVVIMLVGRLYFNINSSSKAVKTRKTRKEYKIKTLSPTKSIIKKELSRFINSPVFITNAGFGLVLFILGCIYMVVKFDNLSDTFAKGGIPMPMDVIKTYLPLVLYGFVCFSSFMTSITSSMISLEGKSINLLKSLPVSPYRIVKAKVLTALLVMIPCFIIGDLIVFIRFKFDLASIILILIASVVMPLIAEIIGILVNLKYPKMDAKNDTEVVKQSMSSAISVFIGMAIIGLTIFLLYKAVIAELSIKLIMLLFTIAYAVIYLLLELILHKTCEKSFDNISA